MIFSLQTRGWLRFFIKNFEHRNTLDLNKAEEPAKLTPNSVFLYRDHSNYFITRRSAERFLVFMLLTQALTLPAAFMYIFLGVYFHYVQKTLATTQQLVMRMDLLPETEQLHILKIGAFGFPKSVLCNVNDLKKMNWEEDKICKLMLFLKLFSSY